MPLDYTAEKLYNAAHALATGPEGLRQRLASAWLTCHTLSPTEEDFSNKDLRERFRVLIADMTSKPAVGDEGTVNATLHQASDDDLHRWASELFSIYHQVAARYARRQKE
jgi:hypothetical protein